MKIDPDNWNCYRFKGYAYLGKGMFDKMQEVFNQFKQRTGKNYFDARINKIKQKIDEVKDYEKKARLP